MHNFCIFLLKNLHISFFCSTFAVAKAYWARVAHYLRLVAFRFYSLQFSGTEVRLNGGLMLRAGFNTHQLNFTQPAPIHRAGWFYYIDSLAPHPLYLQFYYCTLLGFHLLIIILRCKITNNFWYMQIYFTFSANSVSHLPNLQHSSAHHYSQ